MRAILYKDLNLSQKELLLEGNEAHHLIKVARIKIEERVLVLNGDGLVGFGIVKEVNKKSARLEFNKVEEKKRINQISLLLGLPKKEAFEEILRSSVELGIRSIYFWKSEYSQHNYKESDRYQRILESALIQSNNPFFPKLHFLEKGENVVEVIKTFDEALYFCSHDAGPREDNADLSNRKERLLVIGPEGGFSPVEEERFYSLPNLRTLHLPTPIMRAPTAVAAAVGHILKA